MAKRLWKFRTLVSENTGDAYDIIFHLFHGSTHHSSTVAPLACHRIRDLNDEINKLIREKGHWERRIVELGGPDYSKSAPKVTDSQGREVAELTGKQRLHMLCQLSS